MANPGRAWRGSVQQIDANAPLRWPYSILKLHPNAAWALLSAGAENHCWVPEGQDLGERSHESRSQVGSNPQTSRHWWQLHHSAVCCQGGQSDLREVCAWGLWYYHQGLSRSGDAVPHTPRWLVAGRVRLPLEVELSTCPGSPGWKAYSNQMSTKGRHPLRQLQGLPLHCTFGPVEWRLQVPVGGDGGSWVNFRCSDFQAHLFEAQIEDSNIGFPNSESLGIGGPKANFFILGDDAFPFKLWLMRPYSSHSMDLKETVFNYRIKQGRTVVENAFGMLTSRFRIFQSPLQQEPRVVNRVVMACLVLHNLLRVRYPTAQQEDLGGEPVYGSARVQWHSTSWLQRNWGSYKAEGYSQGLFHEWGAGPRSNGHQLKCERLLYCDSKFN